MDAFTMTTPAETVHNDRDDLIIQINSLKEQNDRMQSNYNSVYDQLTSLRTMIGNVKGYFADLYSENGELEDEIKYIAELLDITLMKEIAGTAKYEINWTAQVPLDFDADDFEISFDVNCETYEADDFDYNEDNTEVCGEDV